MGSIRFRHGLNSGNVHRHTVALARGGEPGQQITRLLRTRLLLHLLLFERQTEESLRTTYVFICFQ